MLRISHRTILLRVAPRAGAWIEITVVILLIFRQTVAPRAGAWIEIECDTAIHGLNIVAPRAGAWIEICK